MAQQCRLYTRKVVAGRLSRVSCTRQRVLLDGNYVVPFFCEGGTCRNTIFPVYFGLYSIYKALNPGVDF